MVIVAAHPPVKLDCPGSGVYKKQPMDPQQPFQGCDIMPLNSLQPRGQVVSPLA
ncbi:hypothetical protein SNOG_02035 [Parastagonospora nodorum SN15]|uniref:Uncharacterized protein n=1 Tax=Phaeosphaeria nodorum (strain SN15 / ATCC MYA-4574 / FGSC 10173) TaxID=321614 RepID=Q0V1S9_PHANO|nr:hypothetical protein SNOG_02035 [Parastagonospora nodorum SN15]EAT90247.1 hypothetical protein SNOG_02035 [Parastagonospora nodorum SN15]